ncbi:VOC family protein [Halomonas sp. HP20-15]|uniref:VOC family protein n=1 Tax=Halomonas sp. HP20-15 TaxID=3085901 RepID=UPI00298270B5|nr:VOC family protein [Halomonas sp. HP20-15]MDW5377518.1 VOC family protein [Halomonas sp. HP20-15]
MKKTTQINPYLFFQGQCEAAFRCYEQCLGGHIDARHTYAEAPEPDQNPPGMDDKIMHIRLAVGDWVLMGSDSPADYYQAPQGFAVSLVFDEPAEAERVFNTLATDGSVTMPLAETFWADRFGMLVDRFGIPWMINCEKSG